MNEFRFQHAGNMVKEVQKHRGTAARHDEDAAESGAHILRHVAVSASRKKLNAAPCSITLADKWSRCSSDRELSEF